MRKSYDLSGPYLALAAAQLYGTPQLYDEYRGRHAVLLGLLKNREPVHNSLQHAISEMFPLVDNIRIYVGITFRTRPEFALSIRRERGLWRLVSRNITTCGAMENVRAGVLIRHETPDNAPGILTSITPYDLHRVMTGGVAVTALLGDLNYPEIDRQLSQCACAAHWFNAMGDGPNLELRVTIDPGRVIFGIHKDDIPQARFIESWPLVPLRDRKYTWSSPKKFLIHADVPNHGLDYDEIRCMLPESSICTEAYFGDMTPLAAAIINDLLQSRVVPLVGYQRPGHNVVEVYGLAYDPYTRRAEVMNFCPLRNGEEQIPKRIRHFSESYPLLQWDGTGRLQPNRILIDVLMETMLTTRENNASKDRFHCALKVIGDFIIKDGHKSVKGREFFNYIRDYQMWPLTDEQARVIFTRRVEWKKVK